MAYMPRNGFEPGKLRDYMTTRRGVGETMASFHLHTKQDNLTYSKKKKNTAKVVLPFCQQNLAIAANGMF